MSTDEYSVRLRNLVRRLQNANRLEIWACVRNATVCIHPTTRLCRVANNFGEYCEVCGCNVNGGQWLKHSTLSQEQMDQAGEPQPSREWAAFIAACEDAGREASEKIEGEMSEAYRVARERPEWKRSRALAMERDGELCQSCRRARATVVHHDAPEGLGPYSLGTIDAPCFRLYPVCKRCHDIIEARKRHLDSGIIHDEDVSDTKALI